MPHIWGTAPVAQWRTRFPNGKVSRHPSDAKNVTRPALPGPRERGLAISAPVLAWSWQSARACVRTSEGIVLHLYLLSQDGFLKTICVEQKNYLPARENFSGFHPPSLKGRSEKVPKTRLFGPGIRF